MGRIDKGDGVEIITSLLAESHNPTQAITSIAIGNGLNDLPMLEVATLPFCPGNAEPEVCEFCRSRSGIVSEHDFIEATLRLLEEHS